MKKALLILAFVHYAFSQTAFPLLDSMWIWNNYKEKYSVISNVSGTEATQILIRAISKESTFVHESISPINHPLVAPVSYRWSTSWWTSGSSYFGDTGMTKFRSYSDTTYQCVEYRYFFSINNIYFMVVDSSPWREQITPKSRPLPDMLLCFWADRYRTFVGTTKIQALIPKTLLTKKSPSHYFLLNGRSVQASLSKSGPRFVPNRIIVR
jgi:hypothetical protein